MSNLDIKLKKKPTSLNTTVLGILCDAVKSLMATGFSALTAGWMKSTPRLMNIL